MIIFPWYNTLNIQLAISQRWVFVTTQMLCPDLNLCALSVHPNQGGKWITSTGPKGLQLGISICKWCLNSTCTLKNIPGHGIVLYKKKITRHLR